MRNGMEDGQLVMLPPLQINQIIDGGGDADELTFLSAEVFYTRNSSETLDKDKKSAKQIVVSESHEETNFRIRHQCEKCSASFKSLKGLKIHERSCKEPEISLIPKLEMENYLLEYNSQIKCAYEQIVK